MKSVIIGLLVFCCVEMANAQPQEPRREHRSISKIDGASRGPHSNYFQGHRNDTVSFRFKHIGSRQLFQGCKEGKISNHSMGNRGRKRQYDGNEYRSKESVKEQKSGSHNKIRPLDKKVMDGPGSS